ncbi:MAG TPA: hypothetical protein ENJ56_08915, partial [Anaerolineae bacterium]|nr:hypothetical protein [Anaerolineae bacterium]
MTFDEFQTALFRCYDRSEYYDGFDLIATYSAEFPTHAQQIAYWQTCLAARLGQTEIALNTLEEALAAKHWFSPTLLQEDGDLQPLHASPRFAQIVAESEARMVEVLAESTPASIIFEPTPLPETPLPLLFVLHGEQSDAKDEAEQWAGLAEQGWLVVLPQASDIRDLVAYWGEISAEYAIDPSKIVLAGYASGCLRALKLASCGQLPATGLIGIAPTLPSATTINLPASLRCFLAVGERDAKNLKNSQILLAALQEQGVVTTLATFTGTNQYPTEMTTILQQAIEFVA